MDNPYKSPSNNGPSLQRGHEEESSARPRSPIPFLLALALSFLSFVSSRLENWDAVLLMRLFNFLVIGPLWAVAVFRCFSGRMRIVLAIVAFLLPASVLSMIQTAVLHTRETIPRSAMTHHVLHATARRIQEYMKQHRQTPPDLSVLPVEDGRANSAVDGWGHDLQYSVDRDGVITLTSFGADGRPGGNGQNEDIVVRYRTRNADGTLNVDDELWLNNARIK